MSQTIRASDISLHDLKVKFGLQRTFDSQFFPEWQPAKLPEMIEVDKRFLDRAKEAYFNLIEYPPLLEDTVKMAVLASVGWVELYSSLKKKYNLLQSSQRINEANPLVFVVDFKIKVLGFSQKGIKETDEI